MLGYGRRNLVKEMGIDYIALGIFGQILGACLTAVAWDSNLTTLAFLSNLLLVLATGSLVAGCGIYARFHGLNRWWGLLGFINVAGVFFILILSMARTGTNRGKGFSVIFAEPYRRDVWRMDVSVRLDESLASGVGEPIMLQLPRGANVGTAMKTLAGVIAGLQDGELPTARFSINGQSADRRTELGNGDELVVCSATSSQ